MARASKKSRKKRRPALEAWREAFLREAGFIFFLDRHPRDAHLRNRHQSCIDWSNRQRGWLVEKYYYFEGFYWNLIEPWLPWRQSNSRDFSFLWLAWAIMWVIASAGLAIVPFIYRAFTTEISEWPSLPQIATVATVVIVLQGTQRVASRMQRVSERDRLNVDTRAHKYGPASWYSAIDEMANFDQWKEYEHRRNEVVQSVAKWIRLEVQSTHPLKASDWQVSVVALENSTAANMRVVARSEPDASYPGFNGPFAARFTMAYYALDLDKEIVVDDIRDRLCPFSFAPKQLEQEVFRSKLTVPISVPENKNGGTIKLGVVTISSSRPHHFGKRHRDPIKASIYPALSMLWLMLQLDCCRKE